MSRVPTSREVPLVLGESALLLVDLQNYCCRRDGGEYRGMDAETVATRFGAFFRTLETVTLPAVRRLQEVCRRAGIEVLYTVIESLTRDGRDRSLDYKISGLHVPRGSWDARVVRELAPLEDEIVIPKTSSSVFVSTNIDFVLRNLGVRHLVICGVLTDQCVESAVRDACDLGYLVTLVTDGCATLSDERQEASLRAIRGYCRQRRSAELVAEIEGLMAAAG